MRIKPASNYKILIVAAQIAALLLAGMFLYKWWTRRSKANGRKIASEVDSPPPVERLEGLSEVEAASRLQDIDLDKLERAEARRFFFTAIRKNLFTIFNIDLFGIGILMYILGSPTAALGSLIVLLIALVLNVFQEVYTKNKLDRIVRSIKPQAAVIREGRIKSIDPLLIVEGDLLILRPGDHVLVNGLVVGDGSITMDQAYDQESKQIIKNIGDTLQADEYCVEGQTVYQALEAGARAQPETPGSRVQLLRDEKTPLQRLINNVFLALFVMVIFFSVALLIDAAVEHSELVSDQSRDAFSIILGVAPTSLFMVLIVQYAVGTFRVSEAGALVYRSESIESLANVSTVCFSHQSLTGGLQVKLEQVAQPADREPLSENLVRQVLGDILHSSTMLTQEIRHLSDTFPGTAYTPLEIAPFLSEYGWYGATFDEPDLRGTFVIGYPQELEPYLIEEESFISEDAQRMVEQTQRGLRHWLGKVTRREQRVPDTSADSQVTTGNVREIAEPQTSTVSEPETGGSRRQRLVTWLQGLLIPIEEKTAPEMTSEEWEGQVKLLFAYLPDPKSLYDQRDQPRLPASLIPLSYLNVSDRVRPEIREVMQELMGQGMEVKILSTDPPDRANVTMRKLGLEQDQITQRSGSELESRDGDELTNLVRETMIFGDLTPSQKTTVIQSLRSQGEYIAMVGHDTSDVLAMRQSDLRLALRSGAQAAVRLTDIVILEDSMKTLPIILAMGQRLVSGVLDTFKLYLSQVGM